MGGRAGGLVGLARIGENEVSGQGTWPMDGASGRQASGNGRKSGGKEKADREDRPQGTLLPKSGRARGQPSLLFLLPQLLLLRMPLPLRSPATAAFASAAAADVVLLLLLAERVRQRRWM